MKGKYLKRIHKEVEQLKKHDNFVASGFKEKSYRIVAKIKGPDKTAFRDKYYYIRIEVDIEKYPLNAPSVTFISKIFHPNVSGPSICLDVISEKWSPILGLESIIISIQNLLNCPNPKDPLDSHAASHYMKKGKKTFYQKNAELNEENQKMENQEDWITNSLGVAPDHVLS